MKYPSYELVGGPLDGERVSLYHGDRYIVPLPPDHGPAVRGEPEPYIPLMPRTATYTLQWLKDERVLVWDGEKV